MPKCSQRRLTPVTLSGRICVLAALPNTIVTLNFRGQLLKTMNFGAKFRNSSKAKFIPNSVTTILVTSTPL